MTIALLGQALVLLAFCAALAGIVLGAAGGARLTRGASGERDDRAGSGRNARGERLAHLGVRATHVLTASTLAATALLLVALGRGSFALRYVVERTSTDLPLGYRLSSLWAGQEGSLLLWLAVLSVLGTLMVRSARRRSVPLAMVSYANAVLLAIALFFALLVAFVARPFALAERLATDGAGMSPALQNYWMAAHPPALYLGYVGVAIPFALVAGALLARVRDDSYIALTRRWALLAWLGLATGLLLGARWAYEEVGWGGYWAWDPVENAALMPWLTLTAFLHSVMVQQRRGMLRYWNAVLIVLTFGLSIFGTFLTRSGVLSSVHSFVSSPVGWYFIGFLAVVIVASLALLYASRNLLRARHTVQGVVSREAVFLFNNLLLVSIALTVLWGVLFPIATAALGGARISLQAPWYNFFAVAFGLPLLALTGIGPWVSWQRSSGRAVVRALVPALVAGTLVGFAGLAAGLASSPVGLAAIALGSFVVAGTAADLVRGTLAHRRAHPGTGLVAAAGSALARNRRRYGGLLAHAGIGLLAIAVAGSSAYDRSVERTLTPGQQLRVGAYDVTYDRSTRERSGATMRTRVRFAVRRAGRDAGAVWAGKDFHPASGEVSNEVGIRGDVRTGEDLYLVVDRLNEDGRARVRAIVNPAVNLLWLAGLAVIAGGVIAAVPGRRFATAAAAAAATPPRLIRTPTSGYKHEDAMPLVHKRTGAPGKLLPGVRSAPAAAGDPNTAGDDAAPAGDDAAAAAGRDPARR